MSDRIKFPLVLGLVCLAAGFGISFTYSRTKPKIEERERTATEKALGEVMPGTDGFEEVEPGKLWRAEGGGLVAIGQAQGYSSKLRVMVGASPREGDLVITGIKVLYQQETPGLGARVEEVKTDLTLWDKLAGRTIDASPALPWFQEQFAGVPAGEARLTGDGGRIDGISGATISSEAVVKAVHAALETIRTATVEASGGGA